jgi:RNA polymerase sigma factor (sigma-70 family)
MTDEAALAAAFLAGRDEHAFRVLYRATTPSAYGLALRLAAGDGAEAAELVQEAWVRALERVDRFRAGGPWTPWLRGFVVNCWRERVRHRLRHLEVELDEQQATRDVVDMGAVLVDAAAVRAAVRALPDGYRAALVLHDVEGYTHEEIAVMLGIAPGTSKSQLARARARLRATLGADRPPASRNTVRDSRGATK